MKYSTSLAVSIRHSAVKLNWLPSPRVTWTSTSWRGVRLRGRPVAGDFEGRTRGDADTAGSGDAAAAGIEFKGAAGDGSCSGVAVRRGDREGAVIVLRQAGGAGDAAGAGERVGGGD